MGISTDPTLLDVELPATLIESPSVSTFLPEEEASTCPLLSTTNGTSTPVTFSHPLTPCIDNDSTASANLCNDEDADAKVETSSSSGSSSGIGMDAPDTAATTLFHKTHAYQHLQVNNGGAVQVRLPKSDNKIWPKIHIYKYICVHVKQLVGESCSRSSIEGHVIIYFTSVLCLVGVSGCVCKATYG